MIMGEIVRFVIVFTLCEIPNAFGNLTAIETDDTNWYNMDKTNITMKHVSQQHIDSQVYKSLLKSHSTFDLFDLVKPDNRKIFIRKRRSSQVFDGSDISKRCLCPWTTSWDYDNRRSPVFIPKAKCGNECNLDINNLKLSKLQKVLTSCEPFTRDIRIFKDNRQSYLKDWPVACICMRKMTSLIPRMQRKTAEDPGRVSKGSADLKKQKCKRKVRRKRRRRHKRKLKQRSHRRSFNQKHQINYLPSVLHHRRF